ncbi:MAG: GH32 C-terminal domain-containing protein, partial [Cyclobacteriaceae bacterium]|nr:GH32 C-terminal domain-containing protein [Cyclobacteriaceae bacterium]
ADNYAGVTWSDIPATDGRRLFIGWMSNWQYANVVPTEKWRSATTLPREIMLEKSDTKYALKFKPVVALTNIQGAAQAFERHAALDSPLSLIAFDVKEGEQTFSLTISNEKQERVVLSLDNGIMSFDRRTSGVTGFNAAFPAVHKVDMSNLIVDHVAVYVDLASIEIFINDGERVLTEIVFPTVPYKTVHLDKTNPSFAVSTISSIWQ